MSDVSCLLLERAGSPSGLQQALPLPVGQDRALGVAEADPIDASSACGVPRALPASPSPPLYLSISLLPAPSLSLAASPSLAILLPPLSLSLSLLLSSLASLVVNCVPKKKFLHCPSPNRVQCRSSRVLGWPTLMFWRRVLPTAVTRSGREAFKKHQKLISAQVRRSRWPYSCIWVLCHRSPRAWVPPARAPGPGGAAGCEEAAGAETTST